jgi:predicted TPR repeat methyltransferase/Flp pilus assembly protein TadD
MNGYLKRPDGCSKDRVGLKNKKMGLRATLMANFDSHGRAAAAEVRIVNQDQSPDGADSEILDQATASFKAGLLTAAERLFDEFLQRHPGHGVALDRFGALLAQTGRYQEAERHFRQAIDLGLRSAQTFYNHGTVLKYLQRPSEALQAFSHALAINPSNPDAWNNRGTIFNDLARYQEAISDFDRAIALQADFAGAFYNRAKSLLLAGRHAEAAATLDRALTVKPDLAQEWVERQALLRSPHPLRRSTRPFDACLAEAWVACGNVLYRYQRLTCARRALAAYERALALQGELAEAWLGRGQVLQILGRNDEALAAFDQTLAIEPGLVEAWLGRATTLQALQRLPEAIAAYRQAGEKGGDAEFIRCALASLGAAPPPAVAPRGLVTDLYERYADQYEGHAVNILKYRTPRLLLAALARLLPSSELDILDIGCGTGLFGLLFHARACTLTGVDLSPSMLRLARQRRIYDRLVCGDLIEFLQTQTGKFDLVVAADVFGYIGDLRQVFEGVRRVLRPGGLFCFSAEAGDGEDFVLQTNLRFAHAEGYLRRLAQDHRFALETIESRILRHDDGVDVVGRLVVLRRS